MTFPIFWSAIDSSLSRTEEFQLAPTAGTGAGTSGGLCGAEGEPQSTIGESSLQLGEAASTTLATGFCGGGISLPHLFPPPVHIQPLVQKERVLDPR